MALTKAQKEELDRVMGVEVTWPMIADAVIIGVLGLNPRNSMKLKPKDKRIGRARVFLEAVVYRANQGRNEVDGRMDAAARKGAETKAVANVRKAGGMT